MPEGLWIHDLRHTAASLLVSAGVNVKVVQRHLGHSTETQDPRPLCLSVQRGARSCGRASGCGWGRRQGTERQPESRHWSFFDEMIRRDNLLGFSTSSPKQVGQFPGEVVTVWTPFYTCGLRSANPGTTDTQSLLRRIDTTDAPRSTACWAR
jgi:hypothetical protein